MFLSKKKNRGLLVLGLIATMSLTSCGNDSFDANLPSNQTDTIVTVEGDQITLSDIYYNTMKEYYENITDANDKTLKKLLLNVTEEKIGNGKDLIGYTALTEEEIKEKEEEAMLSKVRSGTYDTDYLFNEEKFVMELNKSLYNIDTSTCDFSKETVINNNSKYDEVFTCDYTNYINSQIRPDIIRNQMITEYLYLDSYTSIGTTAARDVSIVKLVDGKNENVGNALKFINAYLDDLRLYGSTEEETEKQKYAYTQDLNVLSEAYKGNEQSTGVSEFFTLHPELKKITLLSDIEKDVAKIATFDNGHYVPLPDDEIDSTLFSDYTNNMTYSIDVGVQNKKYALQQQNNFIDGMYLSSTGISDIPDAIKTRIFSSNYNTTSDVTKKDVTTYIGGLRLLTTPEGQNDGDNRQVIFYDSSTTAYYLVQINEVVTTGVLAKNSDDTEEQLAYKKRLVKEVSYLMVDQSSYKTDSVVYFLKDLDIEFNNESFYEYMKTTYPALFEEETYED